MPCPHGKQKSRCKDCGGSGICEHGKRKDQCKDCGGSGICPNGKQKSQCKDCGGSGICPHGKRKAQCKECGGSQICEHGKQKAQCKECGGSGICEHGKRKDQCKDCGGSGICEHGKQKNYCKDCGGSQICEHGKHKSQCKDCGGSALCKTALCETRGISKYRGYCLPCCIQVCPDIPVSRNYKTKERAVVDRIIESFPVFTWVADKRVQDGCSLRRPDLRLDMGSHILIVEVDENKHETYDCSCENKRLMEISKDVGHRPIVFIRFNPDAYKTGDGISVSSCWKANKQGILTIPVKKQKEWDMRIHTLEQQILYWTTNQTNKTVEVVELFY